MEIAAAVSTVRSENNRRGKIGDSSMIRVGTYVEIDTCSMSTNRDGEFHKTHVSAHEIAR